MKVRYDLFLYRQSRMQSPTFISVYETTDESETARIWPRRHVQSLESGGPFCSQTQLSLNPSLYRRPFLPLIVILHPTLPPRHPVLRHPHRTRLLLHQFPGGTRHSPTPEPEPDRAGVTVRLTFDVIDVCGPHVDGRRGGRSRSMEKSAISCGPGTGAGEAAFDEGGEGRDDEEEE